MSTPFGKNAKTIIYHKLLQWLGLKHRSEKMKKRLRKKLSNKRWDRATDGLSAKERSAFLVMALNKMASGSYHKPWIVPTLNDGVAE